MADLSESARLTTLVALRVDGEPTKDMLRKYDTDPVYHAKVHLVRSRLIHSFPTLLRHPSEGSIARRMIDVLAFEIVDALDTYPPEERLLNGKA